MLWCLPLNLYVLFSYGCKQPWWQKLARFGHSKKKDSCSCVSLYNMHANISPAISHRCLNLWPCVHHLDQIADSKLNAWSWTLKGILLSICLKNSIALTTKLNFIILPLLRSLPFCLPFFSKYQSNYYFLRS
jgi:hypothetical protein